MNYGKDNLSKKKKSISSKKNMKKKRIGVRIFKAVIICFLLICIIGAVGGGIFVKKIIDDTPKVTPADVQPSGYKTQVVAASGEVIGQFREAGSNRTFKTIDQIPEDLSHAFVAIEDERFYQHNGIDLQGIMRAALVGIKNGGNFSEGASTLTQQLIKNNVFPNFVQEKTFYDRLERKIQEQYLALEIEKQMSKDEILEAYMNTINLGQNCLGVQAASKRYFGKDVSELTLSECTVIAGITQNPTLYDPVVNPEENQKRRDKVLGNMLDQGYITQEEYEEAKADPVYDRIQQAAVTTESSDVNSYFVDEVAEQVLQDLKDRKGYSATQAHNLLYSGGLTIVTTQDPKIQAIVDEEVANPNNYPAIEYGVEFALTITRADGTVENYSKQQLSDYIAAAWGKEYPLDFSTPDQAQQAINEYKTTLGIQEGDHVDESINITPQPQTSVVVMDQYTGQVKAINGGRGEKTTSFSLNRATDSTRQPGSCFKPLSTYAPAIDSGKYTLSTLINDDKPYTYPNGKDKVENWDKVYIGNVTVRYAILHSMNVCAVKTLADIGTQTGYDYLLNFGFTTLVDGSNPDYPGFTDVNLPTALGGITRGVYNLELTAAYAAIANGGVYTKPIFYTKVLDHDGNVILDNSTPETHQVIKDSTAALLTSAMQDVITRGTGTAAQLANGMPASGKTGTSENSGDLWLSAFTPYYTCSVWGGYDSSKPMEGIYNQTWHEVIWKNIMDRINADFGLQVKNFTMPASIEQKTVCSTSGLLAVSGCPTYTEYYAKGTGPTQSCPGHIKEEEKKDKEDEENSDETETDEGSSGSDGEQSGNDGGNGSGNTGDGNEGGGNEGGGNESGNEGGGVPAP